MWKDKMLGFQNGYADNLQGLIPNILGTSQYIGSFLMGKERMAEGA
jgi:hypothetical protein